MFKTEMYELFYDRVKALVRNCSKTVRWTNGRFRQKLSPVINSRLEKYHFDDTFLRLITTH